jgi:hypothetical protein
MDNAIAGNKRPILDHHVTGQQRTVGQNNAIADPAVVSDMGMRHDKVIVADQRRGALFGSTVNGRVFPNQIVFSDADSALNFFFEAPILRYMSDNSPHMNFCVLADFSGTGDVGMGINFDPFGKSDAIIHDRIGTDLNPAGYLGFVVNDCRRMNCHIGKDLE